MIEKCPLSRMSQSLVLAAPWLSSVLHTSTQSFPYQSQYSVSPWGFHKKCWRNRGEGLATKCQKYHRRSQRQRVQRTIRILEMVEGKKSNGCLNKTPRMNMAILFLCHPHRLRFFFFLEDKVSFFFPLFPAFSKHFCLSFMDLLATRAAIYMADIIPISPIMELKI